MKTERSQNHYRARMTFVGVLFLLGLTTILSRAVYLQVWCGPALAQKASGEYERTIHTQGKRGTIFDSQMRELAVSVESLSLAANPRELTDPRGTARKLAKVLDLPVKDLQRRLRENRVFVWIKRQVTPSESQAVRQLKLQGVEFIPEHSRYYPNRMLAAQLLGFTGVDGNGLEGVEYQFDAELRGHSQMFTVLKDAFGRGFESAEDTLRRDSGNNVVLSIDRTIQFIAERALQEAAQSHRAKSGIAVVMEPRTGDVLALAHYPFFNPNTFGDFSREVRRDRAVTDAFEPGSTLKLFSVAAALEAGYTPHTIFYCENGSYSIGRHVVNDTEKHGWLSLQRIVQYSSNIGAVKIGESIGPLKLFETLRGFGFGQTTDIRLPGETRGNLPPHDRWTRFDVGAIAFGQGVSVSALQLTAAVSAIANGGVMMKPRVVRQVTDPKGRVVRAIPTQVASRPISAQTAAAVTRMMEMVLHEGGTGTQAVLDGYTACGKTGTAQKIDGSGTYAKDAYVSSFVGFAPVEDPRLTILVVLDEPREGRYGGVVAAPAFRRIAQEALGYLNVRPSTPRPRLTVSHSTEATG
jgi:cell division protein FtsI (penicillin-binding protein 3)